MTLSYPMQWTGACGTPAPGDHWKKDGFMSRMSCATRCAGFLLPAIGLLMTSVGCAGSAAGVYDPVSLGAARHVAVLPGVGAPGLDGNSAGDMQASLVITSLAEMRQFDVEGPARLRKALASPPASQPATAPAEHAAKPADAAATQPATAPAGQPAATMAAQTEAASKLGIDLLFLPDVTDYRFTKQWKSSNYGVAATEKSRTTYHVAVAVRAIKPSDGRVVYIGSGQAQGEDGFGPAVLAATRNALAELKQFAASRRAK